MIRVLAFLALMLATPGAAQIASGNDANAPVQWGSDHGELDARANRALLWGNVQVRQGSMKLDADRVTVIYSKSSDATTSSPEINRIDATGNVVFTRTDQIARGNMGIYDLDRKIVTFLGNVELTQGKNRLSGARLVIDLNTGRSVLDGRPSATGARGRVTGTFTPSQQAR